MEMIIRQAEERDIQELLDIYNYEVVNGVATLDIQTKNLEDWKEWFHQHNVDNHPLYIAEMAGKVAGYVSLSSYREKEAYQSTVELSVYIGAEYRGQKLATRLMEYILEIARRDETIHTVVSVITAGNGASQKLHEKFGFVFCGTIKEVGVKFGQYRDIDNYSLCVGDGGI